MRLHGLILKIIIMQINGNHELGRVGHARVMARP